MAHTAALWPRLCAVSVLANLAFVTAKAYAAGAPCIPCDPNSQPQCGSVFASSPVEYFNDPSLRESSDVDGAQQGCVLFNLTSATQLDGLWANTSLTTPRYQPPYNALRSANQNDVDEVNVYYHVDRAKRYLDSLGFADVMDYSISINAHDAATGDNSYYSAAQHALIFGSGGVDNAQDPDVIYNVYAHAILDDQVPGFGTSHESASIASGFAAYWAAALTDDSAASALGGACVAAWDATAYNPYDGMPGGSGCLTRVDGIKQYPQDLSFSTHSDGEIWSAALWSLRAAIGDTATDALIIQSHSFLTADAALVDAADALLAADGVLYAGSHAAEIDAEMTSRGIPRSSSPAASHMSEVVSYNCETAHPYSNSSYHQCHYTVPGAGRLRLHFSTFSTEADRDLVRISDANYRQVQVLSGSPFGAGDGYSAAVEGDTIVARFKADTTITANGFTIDQVAYTLAPPSCPSAPANGCLTASAGQLAVKKDSDDPSKNKLSWKWSKGADAATQASFGDPVSGPSTYALCIYDQDNDVPSLSLQLGFSYGGTCEDEPCWKALSDKGWSYRDSASDQDGIARVAFKGGDAGRPSIKLSAKGVNLALPDPVLVGRYFDQDSTVIVQLHESTPGRCWQSTFDTAMTKKNNAEQFKASH